MFNFLWLLMWLHICRGREIHFCCGQTPDDKSYCQYEVGDEGTNIIISAAHGGDLVPDSIPNRRFGYKNAAGKCIWKHSKLSSPGQCEAKTNKDMYTKEIAIALANKIMKITGKRPHLIINNLHRKKLDPNREINQATFGIKEAKKAFNEFHGFIGRAKDKVKSYGLYLDIHGQAHDEEWQELGYLITKSQLNKRLLYKTLRSRSSIHALAKRSKVKFVSLVRGTNSLGYFLQKQGYNTIPSPTNKRPYSGGYFTGGYNIQRWGSRDGGKIDAIQIEASKNVRNKARYKHFSEALAYATVNFMKKNRYN